MFSIWDKDKKIDALCLCCLNKINNLIKRHDFIVDLSDLYEENMFTDSAHVNEEAKNIMALEITKVIKEKLSKACVTK